ncbi:carbohydrate kinase family protein [Actinomyces vulturis]|uniref:carbohydrate kinase family protein n=1 Tax=Actinomyces vulturis TaxID=1857645 RepID=UPI000835BDC8|nr:carbohydrate kinase [Actinomyces vulturis]
MSVKQVIVAGEAVVDIVHAADGSVNSHPGGSPANVAVGLSRSAIDTTLLCCLADDNNGDILRNHLNSAGVNLHEVAVPTTSTAKAFLDDKGAATYEFDIVWEIGDFTLDNVSLFHTGSLATVIQPGNDQLLTALEAKSPDTLITLDPNVRPNLGYTKEYVRTSIDKFYDHAHMVKMSDEDLAWLYPGATEDKVAQRLFDHGVNLFVITKGGEGCSMFTREWSTQFAAMPAEVVDTIGAGDSFMSGFLSAIVHSGGEDLVKSGDLAQDVCEGWAVTALKSAAYTVGQAGAQPPTREYLGI